MKKLIVIGLVLLSGCQAFAWKDPTSAGQLALVKNYQVCSSDLDCPSGMHCGFIAIDTLPVCKGGEHSFETDTSLSFR
jgi:hypothetical protein